jgi:hypothetical protein
MGRLVLVCRIAARDMRRHKAQALLLLLAITGATAVLTLGLALNGVTLAVVAGLTIIPAVLAARIPPPQILQSETP